MLSDTPALDKWRKEMSGRHVPEPKKEILGTIYCKRLERVARPGSQRRCYNGCFPSSDWEMIWTGWEEFLTNRPEEDLKFWQDLSKDKKYKWETNDVEA